MDIVHRINIELWQHVLSIVSIMLFCCAFLVILVFALGMPRTKLSHLENLPLEGDGHE